MKNEIWVVPFFGQGHLLPSMELCKHIASRNFHTILVIPSDLSSSIPSSLRQHPFLQTLEIPTNPAQPGGPPHPPHHHNNMEQALENLLSSRPEIPDPKPRPVCVVLDVMMSWTAEIFRKFSIPTVAFFTSGACSAAMEYAMWKSRPLDIRPGETRSLPGLPEEMALTYSDINHRPHGPPPPPPPHHGGPPGGHGPGKGGPPKEGDQPPWVEEVKGSIAMMINTSDDLERPFLEYLSNQKGIPVLGVGPLLPEQYWKSSGSILHDRDFRTNRRSNVTEDEVFQWLESKPRGSVLYISFGTEVGPTVEEYEQLAGALEAATQVPFIWVIQPGSGRPGPPPPQPPGQSGPDQDREEGYYPHDLEGRVGERGLIIRGWAPQLLILSHPSTGGFLSHCGWNSTVEAIGRGVPFLVWPIRGDQHYDAKLVVKYLRVGYMVSEDLSKKIEKEEIVGGIEKLMSDPDVKRRAVELRAVFEHGFPSASMAALDAFRDLVYQIQTSV